MSLKPRVTSLSRPVNLSGQTALVIGATAGIGAALARQLAEMGATTIIVGRDPTKLDQMRGALEAIAPGRIHTQLADLADLASVEQAARALRAYGRLDIVVSNASIRTSGATRSFTKDGFESSFGVNHLGNAAFLLALEAPLRAAPAGRVVIMASEAHRRAKALPMDDLMGERNFDGVLAYNRSKLANILFARQLAGRWAGLTVYAVHPGGVLTNMMTAPTGRSALSRLIFLLVRPLLLTPAEAAKGIIRIAADPQLAEPSGAYFELGRPSRPGKLADDQGLARQLYEKTIDLLTKAGFSSIGGPAASTSFPA